MQKYKYLFAAILVLYFLGTGSLYAQNTCASPTVIASLPYTSASLTTCGTVDNYAAGTLFNTDYGGGEDYVFSVTAVAGTATLTLGGTAVWKIASVHSACAPTNANAIGGVTTSSGASGSGTITFPSAGTYYIIVDTWPTPTCGNFTLSLSAITSAVPPANDNCSGAIALTVNPVGSCASTVTANTANATASGVTPTGSCTSNTGTPDDDIWYSFVAPASGSVEIQGTNISGVANVYYQVFSSACGGTTSVFCTDVNAGGTVASLTPGNTYYIRFYTNAAAATTSYTLCVKANPPIGSASCATLPKLCSQAGQTLTFGATVGAADASTTNSGNNYGCLSSSPRPSWFYIEMATAGTLDITLQGYDNTNAVVDNDFALWGPFANLAAANAACNTYGTPADCSYASGTGSESINIPASTVGQVYVLVVTAYSSSSASFTLAQQGSSTGTTECGGVVGVCDFSALTVTAGACNNNGTPAITTDDYYTADVTVTYANKPATGNIVLSGTGLHSSNTVTTAPVASGSATTYTFTNVRIKANASLSSLTSNFSANTGCTFTNAAIPAVAPCSVSCSASGSMIWN